MNTSFARVSVGPTDAMCCLHWHKVSPQISPGTGDFSLIQPDDVAAIWLNHAVEEPLATPLA
jgi:hypothetical protein